MLIDEFLPVYETVERHQTEIEAPMATVFEALRELDLSDSLVVRMLFLVRAIPVWLKKRCGPEHPVGGETPALPGCDLNLQRLIASGFILLGERRNEELLLGLVGRFWKADGEIKRMSAEEFRSFSVSGYAKAAWNFSLSYDAETLTTLATETRVHCPDETTRRSFEMYWTIVAPFSGIIRMEALRTVKGAAEANVSAACAAARLATRRD